MRTLVVDSIADLLPSLNTRFEERGLPDIILVKIKTAVRTLFEAEKIDALNILSRIITSASRTLAIK